MLRSVGSPQPRRLWALALRLHTTPHVKHMDQLILATLTLTLLGTIHCLVLTHKIRRQLDQLDPKALRRKLFQ